MAHSAAGSVHVQQAPSRAPAAWAAGLGWAPGRAAGSAGMAVIACSIAEASQGSSGCTAWCSACSAEDTSCEYPVTSAGSNGNLCPVFSISCTSIPRVLGSDMQEQYSAFSCEHIC